MSTNLLKTLVAMYPSAVVATTDDADSIDRMEDTVPWVPAPWLSVMREFSAEDHDAALSIWKQFYDKYGRKRGLENLRQFLSSIEELATLGFKNDENPLSYLCYLKRDPEGYCIVDDWTVVITGPQPATDEEIGSAEGDLGLSLPRSYKDFLSVHNGIMHHAYGQQISAGIFSVGRESLGIDIVKNANEFRLALSPFQFYPGDEPNFDVDKVVPFEHSGSGSYSCFHTDWITATDELGCVLYDHETNEIGPLEANFGKLSFPYFWQSIDFWYSLPF